MKSLPAYVRRNPATTFWRPFLLVGVLLCRLSAAEFSAKITDGLGRPLPEATVEVELSEKGPDGKIRKVQRLKFLSDRAGLVNGSYENRVPEPRTARKGLEPPHDALQRNRITEPS